MIVAGIGFRQSATLQSLQHALNATGHSAPDAIATPSDKADAPALLALSKTLGAPILPITAPTMQAASTLTHSAKVLEKRGTGSVAEACALAALSHNATLLTPRHISLDRLATCAIAKGDPR
ncbi:cobalamin biosynthesis protein [Shimia abyssi]|uniref:Cobalt-precorrin 5A hydrolase n=1 Tax=Shimia abyssi TaxID=1662395 RepID=A0A2P8FDD7_9RHOB|nr:cobalamin biosynthesis protein [Shimia abyssi]PSL19688.1 cobalt-precorrin 5A hydrolase [Shimia abyssi]